MKKIYLLVFLFSSLNPLKSMNNEVYLVDSSKEIPIIIRFKDDYRIRIRNNKLVSLSDCKLDSKFVKYIDVQRLKRVNDVYPESYYDSMQIVSEKYYNRKVGNMNSSYVYKCQDSTELKSLIPKLKTSNYVESYYQDVKGTAPLPPSTEYNQMYITNAADGINATNFWSSFLNRGSGVKIVDIEQGVNQNHYDLNPITFVSNGSTTSSFRDHGTAVAGIINAKNNGWGTTGISSDCEYYFCPTEGYTYSTAAAITASSNTIGVGDIILIEQHLPGPNTNDTACIGFSQCGFVPVEYYYDCYLAIMAAVADGRIVVEAAGNGFQNLDASINDSGSNNHFPFLSANSSGAIIVGAGYSSLGYSDTRSREYYSNYSNRVDLQGIGDNVTTTGYGYLYDSEGINYYYTNKFSGTSSASPMVVGAVALIQSKYRETHGGISLSKDQILAALKATAKPQEEGYYPVSQNIGGLPDVVAAYKYIDTPPSNDSCNHAELLVSNTSCSYRNFTLKGASSSSDISIPNCTGSSSAAAYDVWFKFTAVASMHTITVAPEGSYSGSNNNYIDPVIALYSSCNEDSFIKCENDPGGGGGYCGITIDGLTVDSTYYIRVYDWSASSTIPPIYPNFGICVTHNSTSCTTPTNPIETTIDQAFVELEWDSISGVDSFLIRYRTKGGSWNYYTSNTNKYTLNNLACDSTYEWEIKSICSNDSSDWTYTRQFTTLPCNNTCGIPKNLQSTYITSKSAILSTGFSRVTGAIGYEIRYRPIASSVWSLASDSIPYIEITNLDCNSEYEWQIRTNCDNGLFSAYSDLDYFKTLDCSSQYIDLIHRSTISDFTSNKLNIKTTIKNNGNINCEGFEVEFYLSRDSNFSSLDYLLGIESVYTLDNNEIKYIEKDFSICALDIPEGIYYYGFIIDNKNEIIESNKSNNKWYHNNSPIDIKCTVDLIEDKSEVSYINDFLKFNIGVSNIGQATANSSKIGLFLSKFGTSLDVDLGSVNVGKINGGVTRRVKKDIYICNYSIQEGFYYLIFLLDRFDNVPETNEQNLYLFTDQVYLKCGNSSIQNTVTETSYTLYPNPTTGDIFISNLNIEKKIEVYSIDGRKVKETFTKDKINISNLVKGTYIIKIDNENYKVTLDK